MSGSQKRLNFDINFSTQNQSIWNNGSEFAYKDNRFFGPTWSASPDWSADILRDPPQPPLRRGARKHQLLGSFGDF